MTTTRKVERDSDGWLILERASGRWFQRRWIAIPPAGTGMPRFWTKRGAGRFKRRDIRRRAGHSSRRYWAMVGTGVVFAVGALVMVRACL